MSLLAQIPEWATPIVSSAGVAGLVAAYFMWRDAKREDREAKREEREASRNETRDKKMDDMVAAVHKMTRALALEVLTRPNMTQRARAEAQELQQSVSSGSS